MIANIDYSQELWVQESQLVLGLIAIVVYNVISTLPVEKEPIEENFIDVEIIEWKKIVTSSWVDEY